jgi:hypothetical protein
LQTTVDQSGAWNEATIAQHAANNVATITQSGLGKAGKSKLENRDRPHLKMQIDFA